MTDKMRLLEAETNLSTQNQGGFLPLGQGGFLKSNIKADCFGQKLPFPPKSRGFSPKISGGFRNDRLIEVGWGKDALNP